MNFEKPNHAFILAAGKGERLRPYTQTTPKPMIPIQGRPILDYIFEKLKKSGIENVTINTNYLGDRIKNYTDHYEGLNITLSPEDKHLETGGGVKYALHTMEEKPFYLINGDAFWTEGKGLNALDRLAQAWNPKTMDILLLLQSVEAMHLTEGVGDYNLNVNGQAVRSLNKTGAYMFGGIRITKPDIFDGSPEGAFSFLDLMDKAQEKGRLYGIIHEGEWHHISTPKDLEAVNAAMATAATQVKSA
ncbi:MAG: nucleotidyltransferase family protein [Alphaproteobacteria bacterium]|nr:nucleotidyltransferase family protein [Alphaproteobacteria bacterium]